MNPHEVIVHEMKRHRRFQVLHLLRERIGQPKPQVGLVAVCRDLNALLETAGKVSHEHLGGTQVAGRNKSARYELSIRTNSCPRPHIAIPELTPPVLRDVLLLGIAKAPNLVALNPLAGQITQVGVLVRRTRLAYVGQEFEDGRLGHAHHALGGPNGVPLHQGANDLGLSGSV